MEDVYKRQVGDSDFASEHLGDQRLVVFLREAVGPLRGLHRDLDVVGFGVVAGDEAEGLDLANVVSPLAVEDDVGQSIIGCLLYTS